MRKLINFFVGVGLCVSSSVGENHAFYSHLGPPIWISSSGFGFVWSFLIIFRKQLT